jgi:hypothetical protein
VSRDSSVGIATDYGLDDRMIGVRIPPGLGIFFFDTASRPALGPTQPLIQRVPGALSVGVERPGCEVDHSPPSTDEVKERVQLYLVWYLVKHKDNFTVNFYYYFFIFITINISCSSSNNNIFGC